MHRAARAFAAAGSSMLALAPMLALVWAGCSEKNEVCSWLLAPASFVDDERVRSREPSACASMR